MPRRRNRPRRDHFAKEAKRVGSPARSIFKLEEIDRRWRILAPGNLVLDLGCAPGSWLQYAARQVAPGGRVIGYDLSPVTATLPVNAEARQGDAFAVASTDLPEELDVLLSDMAPATMGHHQTDALRSAALVERALYLANELLKPGGHTVVKILEGGSLPEILRQMRADYLKVEQLRPRATKKRSTEIFLIGLTKRPDRV